jgi:hypothetical protein
MKGEMNHVIGEIKDKDSGINKTKQTQEFYMI